MLAGRFPDLKVVYKPRGKLTPQRGTLCIDKARALIGYAPDFPLERGLPRYVEWCRRLEELEPADLSTDAAMAVAG